MTTTNALDTSGGRSGGAHAGGGADVMADFQGLMQIPQLLGDVRSGVLALRSLSTAPQAAMASGNPAVGGAIVGVGAQLLVFLYQTVQAIGDDIEAITSVAQNYRDQEDRVVAGTQAAMADLDRSATAMPPNLAVATQAY